MRRASEQVADGLLVVGAAGLLISLFLTWSHQYPPSLLAVPGMRVALSGVPANPTGWQVYSAADVLLALLSGVLLVAALFGLGRAQPLAFVLAAVAFAFCVHALSVPPTNGADVAIPGAAHGRFVRSLARAGVGETVAIASLALAVVGSAMTLVTRRS